MTWAHYGMNITCTKASQKMNLKPKLKLYGKRSNHFTYIFIPTSEGYCPPQFIKDK